MVVAIAYVVRRYRSAINIYVVFIYALYAGHYQIA